MAQEGARKSREEGGGSRASGKVSGAEPVMEPLATGGWWLTAGGPTAQREIPYLLTKAE